MQPLISIICRMGVTRRRNQGWNKGEGKMIYSRIFRMKLNFEIAEICNKNSESFCEHLQHNSYWNISCRFDKFCIKLQFFMIFWKVFLLTPITHQSLPHALPSHPPPLAPSLPLATLILAPLFITPHHSPFLSPKLPPRHPHYCPPLPQHFHHSPLATLPSLPRTNVEYLQLHMRIRSVEARPSPPPPLPPLHCPRIKIVHKSDSAFFSRPLLLNETEIASHFRTYFSWLIKNEHEREAAERCLRGKRNSFLCARNKTGKKKERFNYETDFIK